MFFLLFVLVFLPSSYHNSIMLQRTFKNCDADYFYYFEFQILEIWESENRLRKQKLKIERDDKCIA